ncbi:MAG: ABC transporter ATP-binding protein [Euzebya sp.]
MQPADGVVLELRDATLVRRRQAVLRPTTWTVTQGQRWVILGPNGAGKSTILRLASTYELPSSGTVTVLGGRLGRTPVDRLRQRIGVTSSALERLTRQQMTVRDAVATGLRGMLIDWRLSLDEGEWEAVDAAVARVGLAGIAGRRLEVLSEGERRRVQLGRALVHQPELLLLDEPTAGLDIAGREQLMVTLTQLAADPHLRAIVFVTHHVEEIPAGFTHLALVVNGTIAQAGPLEQVLTSQNLSQVFDLPLRLSRNGSRWSVTAKMSSR